MDTNVKTSHGRYACPECSEHFSLKATLKQHLTLKHGISKRQTQDSYQKTSDRTDDTSSVSSFNPSVAAFVPAAYSASSHYSDFNDLATSQQASNDNFVSAPTSLNSAFSPVSWRCVECAKCFDAQNKLEQHQEAKNHTGTYTDVETSGYETDATVIPRKFTQDDTSGYETDKPLVVSASTSAQLQRFYCHLCSKSFEVKSRLVQHENSEGHKHRLRQLEAGNESDKTIEMFPCNLEECGRQFDSEVKLLQHQGMKHGIKAGVVEIEGSGSETEFRCTEDDCDKVFPTKARLLQHMRDKHPADKSDASAVRQLCQYCDEFNETANSKPFIFLTFVAKHILTAHEKPGYIKGTCPICQARVEKQKNLLTHISRAHLFSRFKEEACFICLRLCKNKDDLLQHSTSVHRFKCTIDSCHSMFPSKPLRDKHMLDKHSVYGCGIENCQRIFPTLEEKIEHMKTPHKGEVAEPVIACLRGLANVHDGGAMSEPSAFRLVREQSPAHHARNSADESCMRSTADSVSDLLSIHRTLQEKVEDLTAFINQFSSHLGYATNQGRSEMTFNKCEELRSAIEGVQRRLTPRVD